MLPSWLRARLRRVRTATRMLPNACRDDRRPPAYRARLRNGSTRPGANSRASPAHGHDGRGARCPHAEAAAQGRSPRADSCTIGATARRTHRRHREMLDGEPADPRHRLACHFARTAPSAITDTTSDPCVSRTMARMRLSGRHAPVLVAQKGSRMDMIQLWLAVRYCVAAICTPAPSVRPRRPDSGSRPTSRPG